MTDITISLPDDLVRQAKEAGLLDPAALEQLLRNALGRTRATEKLAAILSRVDAVGGTPMSEEEIAEEIVAARREHARRR